MDEPANILKELKMKVRDLRRIKKQAGEMLAKAEVWAAVERRPPDSKEQAAEMLAKAEANSE